MAAPMFCTQLSDLPAATGGTDRAAVGHPIRHLLGDHGADRDRDLPLDLLRDHDGVIDRLLLGHGLQGRAGSLPLDLLGDRHDVADFPRLRLVYRLRDLLGDGPHLGLANDDLILERLLNELRLIDRDRNLFGHHFAGPNLARVRAAAAIGEAPRFPLAHVAADRPHFLGGDRLADGAGRGAFPCAGQRP